jgi:hypothetical protein
MSVHIPIGINDALTMLDSRVPLTTGERKMIVDGLYNLAFREGIESEKNRLMQMAADARSSGHRDFASHIEQAVDPIAGIAEYEDPTTRIRRRLAEKKHPLIAEFSEGKPPNA